MTKLTLLTSEFPPFRGGIGVLAYELANAASEAGVDVKVVAPDHQSGDYKALDPGLPYSVSRFSAGSYSGKQMPIYIREGIAAARNHRSGRLVAADSAFLDALALTKSIHRQPFDAILHGSEIIRASKSALRRLIGLRRIYGAPDRFFTNSDFTRSLLLEHMPFVDPNRAITAYPAANAKWFQPPDPTRVTRIIGPKPGRMIVCTGRITPRKGQVTLLRALKADTFTDAVSEDLTVVIAGRATSADRAYFEELQTLAASFDHIKVLIRHDLEDDDLRALYASADLFCLPGSAKTSAVEGFGLVFIEAAAQGLPSVAGAVGAVPETVLDQTTGLLVPPDDPVALGSAIALLLNDRRLISKMKSAALAHASTFSWTSFAKTILLRQ